MVATGRIATTRAISWLLTMNMSQFMKSEKNAEGAVESLDEKIGRVSESTAFLIGKMVALTAATITMNKVAINAFLPFRDEVVLAATAAGEGRAGIAGMTDSALELSRVMRILPQDAAALTKTISFFGVRSEESANALALTASKLERLGGSKAEAGAKTMTTLLRSVGGEGAVTPERIEALGGAIFTVGTNITSNISGLQKFIETFQTLGVTSQMNEIQMVALAGSIADLNESQRAIATNAVQRMFLSDSFSAFGQAMDLSVDEVKKFRREDPVGFFLSVGEALARAGEDDKFLALMKEMQLGGLREARGLSTTIANAGKLAEEGGLLDLLASDFQNLTDLNKAFSTQVSEGTGVTDGWAAAVDRLKIAMSSFTAPVFSGLLSILTKFVDLLGRNPVIAGLLSAGATVAMGRVVFKTASILGGKAMGALAGGAGAAAGGAAAGGGGLAALLLGSGAGASAGKGGFLGLMLAKIKAFILRIIVFILGSVAKVAGKGAAAGLMGGAMGGLLTGAVGAAGGAAAMVGNPIVGIAVLLTTLVPLFSALGNALSELSQRGTGFSIILKVLATGFKLLELAGNTIIFVFKKMWDMFTAITDGFGRIFGIDSLSESLGGALDKLNNNIDDANARLTRSGTSLTDQRVDRGSRSTTINNFDIKSSSPDATRNFAQRAIVEAARA